MTKSRKVQTTKNLGFSIANYIIKIVLGFALRSLFIYFLSAEYLGLNSLFTNVLSILSLAELGVGSAIIFAMYKPVAENNYEKVAQLLAYYKKFYIIIGCIILALGLLILPFVEHLVEDPSKIPSDINIYVVFFIFLAQTVCSYFFSYQRSLFTVTQEMRIETIVDLIGYIATNVLQLLSLILWRSYYLYAIFLVINTFISNVVLYIVSKKKYPELNIKPSSPLSIEDKKVLTKNIYSIIFHKIGAVVVFSTDNLIISKMVGLDILGYYSNYMTIIAYINSFISIFISTLTGSLGNYIASKTPDETKELFKKLNFALFWLSGFCAICLLVLFQPFILMWTRSSEYVLPFITVILIVVSFYLTAIRKVTDLFKSCCGLFYQDRWKPICEAIINLVVSIGLCLWIGLPGVIIGTIVSTIAMPLWVEPFIVYKYYFNSSVWDYWKKVLPYILVTIFAGALTYLSCYFIQGGGIWFFLLKMLICVIVPNVIFFLCFFKTKEFKYFVELLKEFLNKIFHKKSMQKVELVSSKEQENVNLTENIENVNNNNEMIINNSDKSENFNSNNEIVLDNNKETE